MCDAPINPLNCRCSCTNISQQIKSNKKKRNIPHIQHELNIAKAILQETSPITGDNVFDHLSDLIKRIIDERPQNLIDYFEEYSRYVREKKFRMKNEFLREAYEETQTYNRAKNIMNSFGFYEYSDLLANHLELEETVGSSLESYRPLDIDENLIKLQNIWSLCGLGLHRDEVFLLSCALQKLQQHPGVAKARFWGKLFGFKKNYYIVEATLTPSEIEKRLSLMKKEILERMQPIPTDNENSNNFINSDKFYPGSNFQHLPKSDLEDFLKDTKQKPIPTPRRFEKFDIPPEPIGVGLNRYVYFTVNNLTDDWIELPLVTPRQISESRYIDKYLKGDLEADVTSYPYFHGKEKHYLRTLIARITCSTYIAPIGFYKEKGRLNADDEEEEEEEEEETEDEDQDNKQTKNETIRGQEGEVIRNPKYKPLSIANIQDIRMWVHIRSSISYQGRITFFDEEKALKMLKLRSSRLNNEEEEEEVETEEEEEDEEKSDISNESGTEKNVLTPSILVSCADDKTSERTPPWIIRMSHDYNKSNLVAVMKSSLWQGAYCFAHENLSENLYIGWGDKYHTRNFSLHHLPSIRNEYPIDPEIIEINDPTVAQEEEWRIANLPKSSPHSKELSGEENDDDDDDDDEDDDDDDDDDDEDK